MYITLLWLPPKFYVNKENKGPQRDVGQPPKKRTPPGRQPQICCSWNLCSKHLVTEFSASSNMQMQLWLLQILFHLRARVWTSLGCLTLQRMLKDSVGTESICKVYTCYVTIHWIHVCMYSHTGIEIPVSVLSRFLFIACLSVHHHANETVLLDSHLKNFPPNCLHSVFIFSKNTLVTSAVASEVTTALTICIVGMVHVQLNWHFRAVRLMRHCATPWSRGSRPIGLNSKCSLAQFSCILQR